MTATQFHTQQGGGRKVALSTINISQAARIGLSDMLNSLQSGSLELYQLPWEVRAFYFAGYTAAELLLKPRIEQLEHEAATYYERWMNPGKKLSEMKQRRIQQAMAEAYMTGNLNTEADVLLTAINAAMPRLERRAS